MRPIQDKSSSLWHKLGDVPYVVHIFVLGIGGLIGFALGSAINPYASPLVPTLGGICVAFVFQCIYFTKYPWGTK